MSGVGALRMWSGTGRGPDALHVLRGREHRRVGRVRLRARGEVRRRLCQRDAALRQADEVDGVLRRDRDLQRLRVGVADVLGGEDHHATRDEERVFAGLEHAHQPVEGGVGIAAAHAFDEGGDDVVVLLARLVVAERTLLRGLFQESEVERLRRPPPCARRAASSSVPSAMRASPCAWSTRNVRASGDEREALRAETALGVGEGAIDERAQDLGGRAARGPGPGCARGAAR